MSVTQFAKDHGWPVLLAWLTGLLPWALGVGFESLVLMGVAFTTVCVGIWEFGPTKDE